jgi:hypothetical protein
MEQHTGGYLINLKTVPATRNDEFRLHLVQCKPLLEENLNYNDFFIKTAWNFELQAKL